MNEANENKLCPDCESDKLREASGRLERLLVGDSLRCMICKKWFAPALVHSPPD